MVSQRINFQNALFQYLTKTILPLLLFITPLYIIGQEEKVALDFSDYDSWQQLSGTKISNNGAFVIYHEVPGKGDQTLKITTTKGNHLLSYHRGESGTISHDSKYVAFRIKPHLDSIRALKRIKTKKEDLPKDSLGIYDVESGKLVKIPLLKSFKMPVEWNGYITFLQEEVITKDTTAQSEADSLQNQKVKNVSEDNGYHLVVYNLKNQHSDTLFFVKTFELSKTYPGLIYHSTGKDSTETEGIFYYDLQSKKRSTLTTGENQYHKLSISEDGTQVGIVMDTSEVKAYIPKTELRYWNIEMDSAITSVNTDLLDAEWSVNKHQPIRFSQDGNKLYFSTSPIPLKKDTLLLEDEIVQVEIWNYQDQRLHTQQNLEKEKDQKKGYSAVFHTDKKEFYQLSNLNVPDLSRGTNKDMNGDYALGSNANPYQKLISWEGFPLRRDLYLIDQNTGSQTEIVKRIKGAANISPGGDYLYWQNEDDTTYYAYHIKTGRLNNISNEIPTSLVDELDDHPDFPGFYGVAGWTENDSHILIYDRYDVWQINPLNPTNPKNITNGRKSRDIYRLRKLDPYRAHFDLGNDLMHVYNEVSRDEAYSRYTQSEKMSNLIRFPARIKRIQKAKNSETYIFTKETNAQFGDIQCTVDDFKSSFRLSDVNPQQASKKWSTVELVNWTSLDGIPLEGLLYKPEDFDPSRKYPMIVYFYEKNSDNLHRYWGAVPHRSIVNPSFYASRGYLIFVPDIVYKEGYPGASCYNAVIPGITHLIDQGFVDIERIGTQGHSWGGYQTAYLITKTDIFACAESGAPVSNMTSAYGGIRWGTGLSRMFQYERTQSRIGGTLWEYPMRYLENSPLFFVDNINTPVLIMHNDKDGAVPWYQGIEFFVALRRLGKPAWMLNYNNEPHWPVKWENKVDFNMRMQQYFDYYLMGKEKPEWMAKGVPAVEKGYNKGY